MPSSVCRSLKYIVSLDAKVSATYSTSVDDKATVVCHYEYQLTGTPLSMKINHDVDFLVTWSTAQLESEYPLIVRSPSSSSSYVISTFFVAFR